MTANSATRWLLAAGSGLGVIAALAIVKFGALRVDATAVQGAMIERGRYLAKIGGCNDCHTPGYALRNGDVPEDRWLIGDAIGFNGPWGTTYPTNLRRHARMMTGDDWVRMARTMEARPPMPWFNLRAMSEMDLRALHRYLVWLPESDNAVPDYVPPDKSPKTPHFVFVPQPPK